MKKYNRFYNLKRIFMLIFLLFFFTSICAFGYINTVSANISNSVFRLHVIANSNSIEDQNIKYIVRDKLIEYMNELIYSPSSKEEILAIAKSNINNFEKIAKQVLLENGFDYDVNVKIGNFEFPTKEYGDISLPAGFYDALKVEIGEAKGQNWWCVMFPPLCFVDVSSGIVPNESKQILQDELSSEEYYLVSNNTPDIKFKFKLLELFSTVTNTLTAKR